MKYTLSTGVVQNTKRLTYIMVAVLAAVTLTLAMGKLTFAGSTVVPGHAKHYVGTNDYPEAGQYVNGHYTSVYAYDDSGDYYWDLGDGRVQGTVSSVDELDQATLTTCNYVNNYRADFGGDPYMDHGWIQNHIKCRGYDDNGTYNYLIVSDTDPRYTGNPDWAIWNTWEYHVLTQSGDGNLAKAQPEHYVNN